VTQLLTINKAPWEIPAVTVLHRQQCELNKCQEYEEILKQNVDATPGDCCIVDSERQIELLCHSLGGSSVRLVHEAHT